MLVSGQPQMRQTGRYIVTSLIQQLIEFWMPTECRQCRQVLVAGEYVLLTERQARRYAELVRTKDSR